jgi:hypothetical protein
MIRFARQTTVGQETARTVCQASGAATHQIAGRMFSARHTTPALHHHAPGILFGDRHRQFFIAVPVRLTFIQRGDTLLETFLIRRKRRERRPIAPQQVCGEKQESCEENKQ